MPTEVAVPMLGKTSANLAVAAASSVRTRLSSWLIDRLPVTLRVSSKKVIDCQNCENCGFSTDACRRACNDKLAVEREFPSDCLPLVHDGEVCLRVLLHASCDDYAAFVSDVSPRVPTECMAGPGTARARAYRR